MLLLPYLRLDEPMLDPQELQAIRDVIRQSTVVSPRVTQQAPKDAVPMAIIAEDRAAEHARAGGIKLATRWTIVAQRRILRLLGTKLEFTINGVETVGATAIREELDGTWLQRVGVVERPKGFVCVSVGGDMIVALVVRLLGGEIDASTNDRDPSPTALKLFSIVGESLVGALCEAWKEEQGFNADMMPEEDVYQIWRQELTEGDLLTVVTLSIRGPTTGVIRLLAQPETLVAPQPPLASMNAPRKELEDALSPVPVELSVELGKARLSMSDVGNLNVGSVVALERFIDDLLPIECGGVLKGLGRVLMTPNGLAIKVEKGPLFGLPPA